MGLADDHRLLRATRLWSTGIFIHSRVVVTAAHAPRSPLVMGDRILVPGIVGKSKLPQRIVRVSRIVDHPKARTDPSFDVRLLILHYEDGAKGVTSEMVAQVESELQARCRPIVPWEGEDPVTLYGFVNVNAVGSAQTYSQKLAVARTLPDGPSMRDVHRYEAVRERILEPVWPLGAAHKQSEFGDSGAPVVLTKNGRECVVGMYVRRSTNRPVSKQPDLVAIRLYEVLRDWGKKVLDRHGIELSMEPGMDSKVALTGA